MCHVYCINDKLMYCNVFKGRVCMGASSSERRAIKPYYVKGSHTEESLSSTLFIHALVSVSLFIVPFVAMCVCVCRVFR